MYVCMYVGETILRLTIWMSVSIALYVLMYKFNV